MKASDLEGALPDHGSAREPEPDPFDGDLTDDEMFAKYVVDVFPTKIGKEIKSYYPDFKFEKHRKLKKLVRQSAFIYGPPGTGKTFTACALVVLSRRGGWLYLKLGTRFYRVSDLLGQLRDLVTRQKEKDPLTGLSLYSQLVEDVKRCRYLILDDFGIEKKTDFTNEILNLIIDSRYNHNRATIITTNLDIKEFSQAKGYSRIMSRMMDMVDGRPIKLTEVYRQLRIKPKEL